MHVAPEAQLRDRLCAVPGMDYAGVDLESPLADEHFDLTAIPYPDASVDAVLCNHVLEHILDDRRAMREMVRVLRPGGWAVLQVPIKQRNPETDEGGPDLSPSERERRFWQDDHVRLYGADYPERLREEGFEVEPDAYPQRLGEAAIRRYGLDPKEVVYRAFRPA